MFPVLDVVREEVLPKKRIQVGTQVLRQVDVRVGPGHRAFPVPHEVDEGVVLIALEYGADQQVQQGGDPQQVPRALLRNQRGGDEDVGLAAGGVGEGLLVADQLVAEGLQREDILDPRQLRVVVDDPLRRLAQDGDAVDRPFELQAGQPGLVVGQVGEELLVRPLDAGRVLAQGKAGQGVEAAEEDTAPARRSGSAPPIRRKGGAWL